MTVYTYVIDNTEYVISDDDQSIAGAFWKKQAVCAGYAGAVQYLLERLDIPVFMWRVMLQTVPRDMPGIL
mgnify:FL=1